MLITEWAEDTAARHRNPESLGKFVPYLRPARTKPVPYAVATALLHTSASYLGLPTAWPAPPA